MAGRQIDSDDRHFLHSNLGFKSFSHCSLDEGSLSCHHFPADYQAGSWARPIEATLSY